jgi:hypothetical protein
MEAAAPAVTHIDIDMYNAKFETYPEDLVLFAAENRIHLPSISSLKGQAVALMTQPSVRGQKTITRDDAVKFFKNIGMETDDAIQPFNKATGLKKMKIHRGNYCFKYPFEADMVDIDKRKGASISSDKDSSVARVKEWWMKNLIDVANDEWQIGHLDPTVGDASEKNLAYQPPIQGKYRDRFKFDEYFHKMWPTASELIPKMNEYYTETEQRALLEALKAKYP